MISNFHAKVLATSETPLNDEEAELLAAKGAVLALRMARGGMTLAEFHATVGVPVPGTIDAMVAQLKDPADAAELEEFLRPTA